MDFLDEIYWNNSIRDYLIVFSVIAFAFLLKKFVSTYFAGLLFIPISRIWKNFDKESFVELIVRPLGWLLAILISIIALYKLNFPSFIEFKIFGYSSMYLFHKLGAGIMVALFIWLLLSIIDFVAFILTKKNKDIEKRGHGQLIPFFRDLLKIILGIFGLLLFISAVFSQDIGSLLTGLSIVGAALALSAKESLENLIASFIIFFDKPFFIGDAVKVNSIYGTVEEIGLRSTRIRTLDKSLVTVPNKQMVDNAVDNQSMLTQRKTSFTLELDAHSDPQKLKTFLTDAQALIDKDTDTIDSGFVHVTGYSKSGIITTIEFYAKMSDYSDYLLLKEKVIFQLMAILRDSQLALATSHSNITVVQSEQATEPKKPDSII